MKKIFSLLFFVALALVLVACGGKKEVTAKGYGLVHGHYVGEVEVTLAKDGKVKAAKIEEYFLPYNLAKVAEADKAHADGVVEGISKNKPVYYAKYVMVGTTLFTAEAVEGSVPVYKAEGINSIEEWVKTEANAKKYVEELLAGKVFIAKADKTKSALVTSDESAKKNVAKSKSGYWTTGDSKLKWKGNVEEMVSVFIASNLEGAAAQYEVKEKDAQGNDKTVKKWSIGEAKSGATVTDFKDYFEVAKRAKANAAAEQAK